MFFSQGYNANLHISIRRIIRVAPALLAFAAMPLARAGQDADGGGDAAPAANPQDKDGFNLFNPVPRGQMRELSPDRPDKTESPFTVDAGHFQLEMDFANFTYDSSGGVRTSAWNVAPFNLKAGLLNNVDVQFVYDAYFNVRTDDTVARIKSRQSGAGDFTLRLKVNLWGDDGGNTAFALLPYVKFPASSAGLGNNAVEGGILLPFWVKLPCDFEATLETGAGLFHNDTGSGGHGEFINSISVDHPIAGKLSCYVEFFSDVSTESGSGWVGTVDAGLEYLLTEDIQLDCGCNTGITRSADKVNPFAGITVRF